MLARIIDKHGGLKVRVATIKIVLLCDWLLPSWTARTISYRKQVFELVSLTAFDCMLIYLSNYAFLHCLYYSKQHFYQTISQQQLPVSSDRDWLKHTIIIG